MQAVLRLVKDKTKSMETKDSWIFSLLKCWLVQVHH